MKKITLLLTVMQVILYQYTYAQSLTIIEQNYEQAKRLAAEQQKLLLIDFYTTWCVPCKQLDKQVFQDTAVSKKIAGDFIVLRYNAEKDSVYQLTKKHHISMYPSAVVLNAGQRVVCQQYGTGGAEKDLVTNYLAFLWRAKQLHTKGFFIKGIAASADMQYPAFYKDYVNRVDVNNNRKKVNEYWDTLINLRTEMPFKIFCYFGGGNEKWNQYFLQHRDEFEALYGDMDVMFATSMIISDKVFGSLQAVNRTGFDSAMNMVRMYQEKEEGQKYIDYMEQRMLQAEGRWAEAYNYLKQLEMKKQASDDDVTRFCEAMTEKCSDKRVLEKASKWMNTIVKKNAAYENLSVYARLLFKTGKKQKSLETMKKAITEGKKMKEDTREEEKWIRQHFPQSS